MITIPFELEIDQETLDGELSGALQLSFHPNIASKDVQMINSGGYFVTAPARNSNLIVSNKPGLYSSLLIQRNGPNEGLVNGIIENHIFTELFGARTGGIKEQGFAGCVRLALVNGRIESRGCRWVEGTGYVPLKPFSGSPAKYGQVEVCLNQMFGEDYEGSDNQDNGKTGSNKSQVMTRLFPIVVGESAPLSDLRGGGMRVLGYKRDGTYQDITDTTTYCAFPETVFMVKSLDGSQTNRSRFLTIGELQRVVAQMNTQELFEDFKSDNTYIKG